MARTTRAVYYEAHPRFIQTYLHLQALYEDKPRLKPEQAETLARIHKEMLENQRLTWSDRTKVRDILRRLGRPMERAPAAMASRGEGIHEKKSETFEKAKKDLYELWEEFGHTSTPPALKPGHAAHLRDIHDMMAFRGKLYESQLQKLYEILDEIRRKEKD